MKRAASKKRQALADLLNHYTFIGEKNLDAAQRFLRAVDADISALAAMPGMGAVRDFANPKLTGLRSWPVKGFRNYLIFYVQTPSGIDVVRVLHGAQDLDAIFDDSE